MVGLISGYKQDYCFGPSCRAINAFLAEFAATLEDEPEISIDALPPPPDIEPETKYLTEDINLVPIQDQLDDHEQRITQNSGDIGVLKNNRDSRITTLENNHLLLSEELKAVKEVNLEDDLESIKTRLRELESKSYISQIQLTREDGSVYRTLTPVEAGSVSLPPQALEWYGITSKGEKFLKARSTAPLGLAVGVVDEKPRGITYGKQRSE